MTLDLLHADPSCTGSWHRRWLGSLTAYWRCTKCRAVYYDAPDVMAAAKAEARMGRLLRKLGEQGRSLM